MATIVKQIQLEQQPYKCQKFKTGPEETILWYKTILECVEYTQRGIALHWCASFRSFRGCILLDEFFKRQQTVLTLAIPPLAGKLLSNTKRETAPSLTSDKGEMRVSVQVH